MATRARKRPQPTPFIWRQAAHAHYAQRGEVGRVARELVYIEYAEDEAIVLSLWTNPDFADPNELDYERGVITEAPEQDTGEHAIALAALVELVSIETLQTWTLREVAKREAQAQREHTSGRRILARDLLATGIPSPKTLKQPEKAMFRAVERWATTARERHMTLAGANRKRVDALIGGVEAHGRSMLDQGQAHYVGSNLQLVPIKPILAVYGWWCYSCDDATLREARKPSRAANRPTPTAADLPADAHPAKVHTDKQDYEAVRTYLGRGGAGMTRYAEAAQDNPALAPIGSAPHLLWLNGLGVELNL